MNFLDYRVFPNVSTPAKWFGLLLIFASIVTFIAYFHGYYIGVTDGLNSAYFNIALTTKEKINESPCE